MKEKNPIDMFYNVLEGMLKIIKQHKGPIENRMSPEVLALIAQIEINVQKFSEHQIKILKDANIDPDKERKKILNDKSSSRSEERHLLIKGMNLEKEAKDFNNVISILINKTPNAQDKNQKEKQQDRQKKFKRLGGNKKWIPL